MIMNFSLDFLCPYILSVYSCCGLRTLCGARSFGNTARRGPGQRRPQSQSFLQVANDAYQRQAPGRRAASTVGASSHGLQSQQLYYCCAVILLYIVLFERQRVVRCATRQRPPRRASARRDHPAKGAPIRIQYTAIKFLACYILFSGTTLASGPCQMQTHRLGALICEARSSS